MFHMSNDSGLFRTAAQLHAAGLVRDGTDWARPGALTARQTPLDMSGGRDDRSLALVGGGSAPPERWVPLYEAKMIHQFDTAGRRMRARTAATPLPRRRPI